MNMEFTVSTAQCGLYSSSANLPLALYSFDYVQKIGLDSAFANIDSTHKHICRMRT